VNDAKIEEKAHEVLEKLLGWTPNGYGDEELKLVVDAMRSVREAAAQVALSQPYAPDTHTGARQEWVKQQIAARIRAGAAPAPLEPMRDALVRVRAILAANYDPDVNHAVGNCYEVIDGALAAPTPTQPEPSQVPWGPDDLPLPEDPEIEAAFPTRSGRHDLYLEAMRMVGAKFTKGGLVSLVTWLLLRADLAEVKLRTVMHWVQLFQPAGSPPPGDEVVLAKWVLDSLVNGVKPAHWRAK
jgi:hypothetical protein